MSQKWSITVPIIPKHHRRYLPFGKQMTAHSAAVALYKFCLALCVFHYLAGSEYRTTPNQSFLLSFAPIASIQNELYQFVGTLIPLLFFITLILEHAQKPACIKKAAVIVVGFVLQAAVSQGGGFYLTVLFWIIAAYPCSLSIEDAAKTIYRTGFVISAAIILLSVLGEIPDNIRYEHGTLRHGLGFKLGIFFSYNLTAFLICWMFARVKKWKPSYYAISLSAGLIIYTIGNGRASFYAVLVLLSGVFLWRNRLLVDSLRNALACVTRLMAIACYPLLSIASFFFAVYIGNPDVYKHNPVISQLFGELIGSRVQYWSINYDIYGVSLRGRDPDVVFPFTYSMDNLYLYFAMKWGIIVLCAICLLYMLYGLKSDSKMDFYPLFFIVVIAFYSLTVQYAYSVAANFSLLFLGVYVSQLHLNPKRTIDKGRVEPSRNPFMKNGNHTKLN